MSFLKRKDVLVVAELSANHNHSLDLAKETIRAAAAAGADAIKLQTYTADTLTIDCDADWFRVKGTAWDGMNLYRLYQQASTPWKWHAELQRVARDAGLLFFSTPFDSTAVDFLESLDVPCHKVASFELIDIPLLEKVGATRKPVILSTGMATLEEIGEALETLTRHGCPEVALLKCTSAYPAEPRSMNLSTLSDMARRFGTVVGVSDHTLGSDVAVAAVALGARIIEKHFILDRKIGGPDSHFSCEPDAFAQLVRSVRAAEAAVGQPFYGCSPDEEKSKAFRKSLFVVADVRAGEPFTSDNVRCIRPGYGLHPRAMRKVLASRAARDLQRGCPLSDADLV